jgi:hypothetical protein
MVESDEMIDMRVRNEDLLDALNLPRRQRGDFPEIEQQATLLNSVQQKYAQTVVSMRILPGCVQFLGEEKRFHTAWTQSGTGVIDGPNTHCYSENRD